jgi:hypothetical protein
VGPQVDSPVPVSGPESRTATRTPVISLCSVLINNSRAPASIGRRRFHDVIMDPVDDVSNSIDIAHHSFERFPDLAEPRRLLV